MKSVMRSSPLKVALLALGGAQFLFVCQRSASCDQNLILRVARDEPLAAHRFASASPFTPVLGCRCRLSGRLPLAAQGLFS